MIKLKVDEFENRRDIRDIFQLLDNSEAVEVGYKLA